MDARRKFAIVSFLVIFALLLQSITPAFAVTSPLLDLANAAAVDVTVNMTSAQLTRPTVPISVDTDAAMLLAQRPEMKGVEPQTPYSQVISPRVRRADLGAPIAVPGRLQPLSTPAVSVGQPMWSQNVIAYPMSINGWNDATPAGTLWHFSLMAGLADVIAWLMDAGSPPSPASEVRPAQALSIQPAQWTSTAPPALEAPGWDVGNVIGLNCGTLIRVGQGNASPVTYTVEEDNYQVYIKDGPRFADGQTWWDIDRRAVSGNPNDGTGWMSQQQSEAASCDGGGEPPIDWTVGEIIGLCLGTEIKHGPALAIHTVVPEDNWLVKVIGGPRTYNGQTWWDTSRKEAGDPSGGTGWVSQQQTEAACSGNGNPEAFLGPNALPLWFRQMLRSQGISPWLLIGMTGDPVNAATGSFTHSMTDLRIPGVAGFDLVLERIYHSTDTREGSFGSGWSSLLDMGLRIANDGTIDVRYPDGHGTYFVLDGDQYAPAQGGVFDQLTFDNGTQTFTLATVEQVTYQFTDKGLLTAMRDRRGNSILFEREDGQAVRIVDTGGRVFRLTYDGDRVSTITDPLGRTFRYTYNNGDLVTATDGNGGMHRFEYADHRMTRMIDPANIAYLQNIFDGVGRVVEQIDAGGAHAYFAYDDAARRTTFTDNLGHKTIYAYDDLKRITSTTDALGYSEHFAYDADYNVTSHTDKRGAATTFAYDEHGNQISATDPLGGVKRFTYNYTNDVTSFTDELGRATTYTYDGAGNRVRTVRPDNSSVQAAYDGRGQMVAQTDFNGNVTTYVYDGAGNLLQVKNALQESTGYTYDSVGRQLSVTDANGHRTEFVYDNNNNVVRLVDPKNQATTYRYDGNNSLVEIIDRRGGVMQYGYDANLKVVREVDREGHVTLHTYDAMYNRTSTTDPRGNVTVYDYDAVYQIIAIKDALGGVTGMTYDPNGNVITTRDLLGQVRSFEFDKLNRLTKEVDPLGGETIARYDAVGQMISYTSPRPATTSYRYDAMGRLTLRTDAEGGEWYSSYDSMGNLLSTTDANGHAVSYRYNAANQLIAQTDAGGHTTSLAYDHVGNLTAMADGRNRVTGYAYDQNDNLVSVTDALGAVTEYAYDAENNLVAITDPSQHVTRYVYDRDEQLLQEIDGNGKVTVYVYDGAHNRVSATTANGAVWSFAYDPLNRLVQRTDPLGQTARFTYDAGGQLTHLVAENGIVTRTDYDALGRISEEVRNERPSLAAGAGVNVTTHYLYDAVGNRIQEIDANGNATHYAYDLLDRLVKEEDAAQQVKEYAYDAVGNTTAFKNPRGFVTQFAYDADNLQVRVVDALNQEVRLSYDANHNHVATTDPQGIVTVREYDALNRLTATIRNYRAGVAADSQTNVTDRRTYNPDGTLASFADANGNTTTYTHDGVHRLVAEQNALGGVTRYGFDPVGNLVQKIDANGHATNYSYDLLNRLLTTTDAAGHSHGMVYDEVGNVVTAVNARTYTTHITYDALNRPATATDARGGTTLFAYDAMGNVLRFADQNGHARTFTYDVVYRQLSTTDAAGYVTAYQYDANGNRTAAIDGNQNRTTYGYDALDRLESATNGEGETTRYRYDGMNNVTHSVEADGVVTRYVYDSLYRQSAVMLNDKPAALPDANTNVRYRYGYDANGNLRTLSDPLNHVTTFVYDALNRLAGEVNPIGDKWAYSYDAAGNMISRRDGNGALTTYSYYDDNQLRQVTYPDGSFILHEYDANHNRVKMTDRLGVSTWSYDELDRLVGAKDALGRDLAYAYDPVGNRTRVTYPDSRSVKLAYFANDWLQSVTDPDGGVTSYVRDGVGQPSMITNPNATTATMTYDKADRLLMLKNTQITGAQKTLSAFRYTLDDVGQRVRIEAEYDWRQPAQMSTSYTYDPLRRLTRTQDNAGVWTEYAFDAAGNRLALRTNDKAFSPRPFDAQSVTYTYNDANQLLTALSDTTYSSGVKQGRTDKVAQSLVAFQHEVSAQAGKQIAASTADNLLAKVSALLGSLYSSRPLSVAATAAALAELRALVATARQDGALNSDGAQASLLAKLDRAAGANNAPAKSGDLQATTFRYDANGNRINKQWPGPQGPAAQGVNYTYSFENLLLRAQDYKGAPPRGVASFAAPLDLTAAHSIYLPNIASPDQGSGAPALRAEAGTFAGVVEGAVTTMQYDGMGRRLVKQYDPKLGASGIKRTEYTFDLLDPTAEFSMWNGQYSNFYRGDSSRLLSMHSFPSAQKYWYQQDGLGSTAGLSKDQGQSVHNYRYDVYGMVAPVNGNWTEPHNHYTFTGQEWDDETKLLHFYARDYDPATGVWMQQDPYRGKLTEPATAHRYGYVGGNPVNYVDRLGYERSSGNATTIAWLFSKYPGLYGLRHQILSAPTSSVPIPGWLNWLDRIASLVDDLNTYLTTPADVVEWANHIAQIDRRFRIGSANNPLWFSVIPRAVQRSTVLSVRNLLKQVPEPIMTKLTAYTSGVGKIEKALGGAPMVTFVIVPFTEVSTSIRMVQDRMQYNDDISGVEMGGYVAAATLDAASFGIVRSTLKMPTIVTDFVWAEASTNYSNRIDRTVNAGTATDRLYEGFARISDRWNYLWVK